MPHGPGAAIIPGFMRLPCSARYLLIGTLLAAALCGQGAAPNRIPSPAAVPVAPELPREFRGVWIATKGNIDWPSRPGLPVPQQQSELIALLEGARLLNLNAVILQVRPQGDALYESTLEPWSEYLSGREGTAPVPAWDPLAFAIREAHARGLELHAWINPFRAKSETSNSPFGPGNFAHRHPDLSVHYGNQIWLDPGEPDVREHTLRVITDLVRRYDFDALHVDDYFYPYPVKGVSGQNLAFPDDRSWQRFGRKTGLERVAWRRQNVDDVVRRAAEVVHREKPWVQFGVSPFGIWRPGHPAAIRGLDSYELLGADSRRWLAEGWVDYAAPQLYWPIGSREQSFPALLDWWSGQNPFGRHLYAGMSPARIGEDRTAAEIVNQISVTRRQAGTDGVVLWNASCLRDNKGGIAQLLRQTALAHPALPPASPWRATNAPALTDFDAHAAGPHKFTVNWGVAETNVVRGFALQIRRGSAWSLELLTPERRDTSFQLTRWLPSPDELRLTPLGRAGATGTPGTWHRP